MGDGEDSGDEWVVKERRQLYKSGNSTVVSLPKHILQEARLQRGDEVELIANREDRTVTIRLVTEDGADHQ